MPPVARSTISSAATPETSRTRFPRPPSNPRWPQFRGGPTRTGYSSDPGPGGDLDLRWSFTADEVLNAVVSQGSSVYVYGRDADRQLVDQWGGEGDRSDLFMLPMGIAFDADGNVYVSDDQGDQVLKFDPQGKLLQTFGSSGSAPGKLKIPEYIMVDADGNLWVPEVENNRVSVFAPDGSFLFIFGGGGSDDWKFHQANAVRIAPDGTVYVADVENHRVQAFDGAGISSSPSAVTAEPTASSTMRPIWQSTRRATSTSSMPKEAGCRNSHRSRLASPAIVVIEGVRSASHPLFALPDWTFESHGPLMQDSLSFGRYLAQL